MTAKAPADTTKEPSATLPRAQSAQEAKEKGCMTESELSNRCVVCGRKIVRPDSGC